MKKGNDKLSQLGGTDQIEQKAAELAIGQGRSRVTNQDREQALGQLKETAPPPQQPTKTNPPATRQ